MWFAISADSDPTGAWTFYAFTADPSGIDWADFPGLGMNSTWIAITQNMFSVAADARKGTKMWVIDKTTALVGGPLTVTVFPTNFDFEPVFNTRGLALMPAVTFDAAEPKLFIVDSSGLSSGSTPLERLSEISGSGPAPTWSVTPGSVFPGTGLFRVPTPYDIVPFALIGAEQLGLPPTCDGGANDDQPCQLPVDCPGGRCRRVMTNDRAVSNSSTFRNGTLWYTHAAAFPNGPAPDRVSVVWFQLLPSKLAATGTPVVQSGIIGGGPRTYYFFPSIAVNKNDDVCIGFSASDPDSFVAGAEATRVGSDPPGTIGPVSIVKAGEDSYFKTFGTGERNRWGDYSATVVDPADDLSFWTIQEYAEEMASSGANRSRWGTWWALKARVRASAPALSSAGLAATVAALLVLGMLLIRHRVRRQ